MAIRINCPTCNKSLKLNDDQAGTTIDCPGCLAPITVPFDAAASPEPSEQWEPEPERKRERPRRERDEDQDDDLVEHRGMLILILGGLSLTSCALCGIPAWILGAQDLKEMRAGRMDRSGENMTYAGYVCGIIGTVIFALGLLAVCLWFAFFAAIVGAGAAGR